MKLDIGAGDIKREGWTTLDAYTNADIKSPMDAIPLDDASVEELRSSHSLEHIPIAKVGATLKEWHRVLKTGAIAHISVPNMDYVARYWLHGEDREYAAHIMFGKQTHDGEFHQNGWTPTALRNTLETAGFTILSMDVDWDYNQETIVVVARKT